MVISITDQDHTKPQKCPLILNRGKILFPYSFHFSKKKKKSNPVTSYFGWSPSKSILSCRTLRNEGKKKSESSYRPLIPGVSWQITLGFSTDVNYCKPCPNGLRYNLTSPPLQHFFYASLVHFPCQGQRSE